MSDQNNANHKTLKGYELPSISLQTGPREGRRVGREKKKTEGVGRGKRASEQSRFLYLLSSKSMYPPMMICSSPSHLHCYIH